MQLFDDSNVVERDELLKEVTGLAGQKLEIILLLISNLRSTRINTSAQ